MSMKKMAVPVLIVLLGLGMAGCSSTRCPCGRGPGSDSASGMTACAKCGATSTQLAEIGTAALKTMMDAGVPMTLVDSRTGKFDDGRRISGAVSLSPQATEQEIQNVLKSKDALIVSYCANLKCQASRVLAVRLQGLGYKHVLEYSCGIEGWATAGNAVTPASK